MMLPSTNSKSDPIKMFSEDRIALEVIGPVMVAKESQELHANVVAPLLRLL